MKLVEVQAAKEFASTFLNDIFFKMAVNSVLDAAPGFDLVRCKECKYRADALDCGNYLCNRKMLGMVRPDDFCSFGEREET